MKTLTPFLFAITSSALAAQSTGNWNIHTDIFGQEAADFQLGIVTSAGDVDNDGHPDILVGASGSSHSRIFSGSAYVYSGATHALLHRLDGDKTVGFFGASVLGLSDVNQDQHDDFLVGESGANRIIMFSGADASVLYHIPGRDGGLIGDSLLKLVDFDNDGIPEFAAGTPYRGYPGLNAQGGINIYSGASGVLLKSIPPFRNTLRLGNVLATCGDLNGDGNDDFMTACSEESSEWIMVYSGVTGDEIIRIPLDAGPTAHIYSMANAGDVDRDGLEDIIVGTPYREVNQKLMAGSAFVVSGADGHLIQQIDGERVNGRVGQSVLGKVDLNRDGYDDILVSSPTQISGISAIAIYSGRTGDLLLTYESTQSGDEMGYSMANVGDLDGDGNDEIAFSAPLYNSPEGDRNYGAIMIADFD